MSETEKRTRLGQHFTPRPVAELMVELISSGTDSKVLDPCTGEGVFLDVLSDAGFADVEAVEIDPELCAECTHAVRNEDFLGTPSDERYDVIVGNPPYVRWKNMDEETRSLLQNDYWSDKLNGLADLTYAFIIWSVEKLRPGGELVFITPFFWAQALHASGVRHHLRSNGRIAEFVHFGEYQLFESAATNNAVFRFVKDEHDSAEEGQILAVDVKRSNGELRALVEDVRACLNALRNGQDRTLSDIVCFTLPQYDTDDPWDFVPPDRRHELERVEDACRTPFPTVTVSVGGRSHELPVTNAFTGDELPDGSEARFSIASAGERTLYVPKSSLGPTLSSFTDSATSVETELPDKYVRLADVCHIAVGMVTGYENAFRLGADDIDDLTDDEVRHALIRVVKGEHTDRYTVSKTVPFVHVPDVETADELRERYPNVYDLLEPHRERLEERYDYGKDLKWFHWAFPRNQVYFESHTGPKLFVPSKDRTPHSRYAYIDDPVYGTQDTVSLAFRDEVNVRADLKYLAALLNSEVLDAWYDEHGIKRGHVTQYSRDPMSDIPVRLVDWSDDAEVARHDRIVELVDEILGGAPVDSHYAEINRLVSDVYGVEITRTSRE